MQINYWYLAVLFLLVVYIIPVLIIRIKLNRRSEDRRLKDRRIVRVHVPIERRQSQVDRRIMNRRD